MKELNERELLLLAYLEGELTGAEKERAEALLAEDAVMEYEYKQLQNTKLVPEKAIVYPNKSRLKKHNVTGSTSDEKTGKKEKVSLGYVLWPAAIAASLALLIMFYSPSGTSRQENLATKTNTHGQSEQIAPIPKTEKAIAADGQIASADVNKNSAEIRWHKTMKTIPGGGVTADDGSNATEQETASKTLLMVSTLQAIPFAAPEVVIPQPIQPEQPVVSLPVTGMYEVTSQRGLLAKVGDKVNHWMGYLQKPKVNFDKLEDSQGKDYWTISLETDKYEWEGKLFSSRR